jgi:hypothetical protein
MRLKWDKMALDGLLLGSYEHWTQVDNFIFIVNVSY